MFDTETAILGIEDKLKSIKLKDWKLFYQELNNALLDLTRKHNIIPNQTGSPEQQTRIWIELILQIKLDDNTQEALKNGVVLCQLMNSIQPGACPPHKVSMSSQPFPQRENIQLFLEKAKKLGVGQAELFMVEDLFEGKNMKQVFICLLSLSNAARNVPTFPGPFIDKPRKLAPTMTITSNNLSIPSASIPRSSSYQNQSSPRTTTINAPVIEESQTRSVLEVASKFGESTPSSVRRPKDIDETPPRTNSFKSEQDEKSSKPLSVLEVASKFGPNITPIRRKEEDVLERKDSGLQRTPSERNEENINNTPNTKPAPPTPETSVTQTTPEVKKTIPVLPVETSADSFHNIASRFGTAVQAPTKTSWEKRLEGSLKPKSSSPPSSPRKIV